MITNLYGTSPSVMASAPGAPCIHTTNHHPDAGQVRYHDNQLQVHDGHTWIRVPGASAHVSLTGPAEDAIAWARKKMNQEAAAENLAKTHPAVADAIDAVRLAEQQLQTVVALCQVSGIKNNNGS